MLVTLLPSRLSPIVVAATLLASSVLLAGCASPPASPPAVVPSSPETDAATPPIDPTNPFRQLQKGLTAARVIALLGEPADKQTVAREGIEVEIWTYTRSITGPKRQVAASMREVPYVHPITGVMSMVQEPVYELESTYITETTELLLHAGILLEWKQQRTSERDFK